MSNYNNKYAYSRTKKIIHDRDCRRIREIPDVEFEMISEFDRSMNTCPDCYRRAVVRYGIGDNRKKLDSYIRVFDLVGFSNKELRKLMVANKAQLLKVDKNNITMKVREDTWKLVCEHDMLVLYHNNYTVNPDFSRTFSKDFHLQREFFIREKYKNAIDEIINYTYDGHINNALIGARVDYINELKGKFDTVINFKQVNESKYHYTYEVIDFDYQVVRFLFKEGVLVNIQGPLPCDYIVRGEPFELVRCRIKKDYLDDFETAMNMMKNYAYLRREYEYIEVYVSLQNAAD